MYIQNHPCQKDCPDRTAVCRRDCERLKAYLKGREDVKKEKLKQYEIDCYQISSIIKNNKRRKK